MTVALQCEEMLFATLSIPLHKHLRRVKRAILGADPYVMQCAKGLIS